MLKYEKKKGVIPAQKVMTNYQATASKATEHNDMFYIITQMIKDFKWMRNEVQRLPSLGLGLFYCLN